MLQQQSIRALTVLLFSLTTTVLAEDFYVSNSGDDEGGANDCTDSGAPCATLGRINELDLSPGDTVHLECGSLWTEPLVLVAGDSGTAGNRVTITDYGSGARPLILGAYDTAYTDDAGWTQDGATDAYYRTWDDETIGYSPSRVVEKDAAVSYYWSLGPPPSGADYIQYVRDNAGTMWFDDTNERLYIHAYGDTDPRSDGKTYYVNHGATKSVDLQGADYVTVKQLEVAVAWIAILVDDDCNESTIRNVVVSGAGQGIALDGSSNRVTECDIHYVGDGIGSGLDDSDQGDSNLTVDNNVFGHGVLYLADNEGIGMQSPNNVNIYDNDISDFKIHIIIISYISDDVDDLDIHHNLFHGSGIQAIVLSQQYTGGDGAQYLGDMFIHDNVFDLDDADGLSEVALWLYRPSGSTYDLFPTDDLHFFNNTMVLSEGVRSVIGTTNGDNVNHLNVRNNIFNCPTRNFLLGTLSNSTLDYNLYDSSGSNKWYIGGGSYTVWGTSSGQYPGTTGFDGHSYNSASGLCANPQYRLNTGAGSDAENNGQWISHLGNDFYGTAHSNPPSIGASEEGACVSP